LKNPEVEIGWKLRVQIAADVARAMAFLHSKKIMHRDLKSKNLLVDTNWKIKSALHSVPRKPALPRG